jgi:hypothetical protein
MKKLVPLLVSLTIYFDVLAQEVNIFWGKDNPVDRFSYTYLLGRKGDLMLGYKQSRKDVSILKYDFDNLQVKGEHLILGKGNSKMGGKVIDNDYKFVDIYILKHKMYICVTKYDRKADKNSIYMQEIDEQGNLKGSFRKLSDISSKSKRNSGSFNVFASEDSTKILIVNNPPYKKYAGEKFEFKIFDEELAEKSSLGVSLPYKNKDFTAEDYTLGKDGNIYLMAQIFSENRDKKNKEEAKYYYEILAINPSGKGQVTEYEVKLKGKYITDISYSLQDSNLICAGFYGDLQSKGGIKGILYMRINKATKQVEATGTKDLDKDFIADLTARRQADKGRGISSSFKIKNFIRRTDGGAILISEYSYDYSVMVCTTNKGATTCHTEYHFVRNNIIAININPDASIKWYTNIPKYQHTVNDGGAFNSYMMTTKGSKMYFVYNDNPKNQDATKVKTPKDMFTMRNPRKSSAVMVELSENGTFNKKVLFSNKENKMIIKPKSAVRISENEQVTSAVNYGVYCCFIPFKSAKSKLVRFEFK